MGVTQKNDYCIVVSIDNGNSKKGEGFDRKFKFLRGRVTDEEETKLEIEGMLKSN